ncbi:MAG: NADH-quinone oxidoreductase subunit L [Acidobacteria bacterium]|nr:NADH-quinone oxidoreductase subunit L [Acidobacteriota bacterium]
MVWLALLFPLLGAAALLAVGRRLPKLVIAGIACGAVAASFAVAVAAREARGEAILGPWLPLVQADWGLLADPLSVRMMLIITGIGTLIHLYAAVYMAGDGGYYRFFGYMNLFVFFMLLLVLANNYALLFAGWEGVGLASYLLIGYYFDRPAAGAAAIKAFLTNRVGDAAFLLGMFLLYSLTGTLRFTALTGTEAVPGLGLATLLLLAGACGKSAQFPLHVWLPDAMEGPTPVSALIHAATMVTAGVYLLARSSLLFALTPESALIAAWIGAMTAFLGATVAVVQTDIKRLLAWSTVSQLGFMFMAAGAGAHQAALFHLTTHAFFKALLFLGAGSVIHALHGEQDLRKMGGLARRMPATFFTMFVGAAALAGVPGFAGFFSKDEILHALFESSGPLFITGLVAAILTALYSTRLVRMVFGGPPAEERELHQPPRLMTAILAVLAGGSFVAGWAGMGRFHMAIAMASVVCVAVGWLLGRRSLDLDGPLYEPFRRHWYIDELYQRWIVQGLARRGGAWLSRFDAGAVDGAVNATGAMGRVAGAFSAWWDAAVVDGIVRNCGFLIKDLSYPVRLIQTGQVQTYGIMILAGVILLTSYLVFGGRL